MMKLTEDMPLHNEHALYQFTDRPCTAFQAENCGPAGMVLAAKALMDGLTVAFAICRFETVTPNGPEWMVKEIIRMAVPDGLRVVRYLGEGGPMGAGSHSVHGSGSLDAPGFFYEEDLPLLTACVCMAVCRTGYMAIRVREDI
jgi:hypothetical protein